MFESFRDSQRLVRAKSDTKGFEQWLRNLIGSIVPAAIQYLVDRRFATEGESLLTDFLWACGTGVMAFLLFPAFELGWNWLRAPRRIMADELESERGARRAAEAESEAAKVREASVRREMQEALSAPKATSAEWRDIGDRFRRVNIQADWRESSGQTRIELRGTLIEQDEFSVLAEAALALVRISPFSIDPQIFVGATPCSLAERWLFIVKALEPNISRAMSYGTHTDANGVQYQMFYGSLDEIGAASARVCMSFSAKCL